MPEKTNKAGLNGSKIAVLLILGFVNAPSLMQLAVSKCLDATTDVAAYDANRKLLYKALTE